MSNLDSIFSLFQRKTNTTNFIAQIDGLRFVAIFLACMEHLNGFITVKAKDFLSKNPEEYWYIYRLFAKNGIKGVVLFFLISGFILGIPFAKQFWQGGKVVSFKDYFKRRLTRLEPPYILAMILSFLPIILLTGHEFTKMFPNTFFGLLPRLGASLLYLHNIIFPNNLSINPVAWTLEIEVQFYILVPLLVLIFKVSPLLRRLVLLSLITAFVYLQHKYPFSYQTLYSYIQYFMLGFLVLDLYLNKVEYKIPALYSFVIGSMSFLVFLYMDIQRSFLHEYLFIIAIFIFVYLSLTDVLWKKIFSFRVITSIGGMCYSIYLLHLLVMSAVGNFTIKINPFNLSSYPILLVWHLLFLIPAILIVCSIFFLIIEKPCMDPLWPKKLFSFLKSSFKKLVFKFLGKKQLYSFFYFLYKVSLKGMNVGGGSTYSDSGEDWVVKFLSSGKNKFIVFDVGANVGNYALMANQNIKKEVTDKKIFCFEPGKKTYEDLKENTKDFINIKVFNFALGETKELRNLFYKEEGSGLASLYNRDLFKNHSEFTKKEPVNILTLDEVCSENSIENIDLLKIDVEGNELAVLKGAQKMLLGGKIQAIQFEFGGTALDSRIYLKDFFQLLGKDFTIFRVLKNGLYELKKYSEWDELFVTTNYLAIRK